MSPGSSASCTESISCIINLLTINFIILFQILHYYLPIYTHSPILAFRHIHVIFDQFYFGFSGVWGNKKENLHIIII